MHDPHLRLFIDDHEIAYRRGLTRFIERPHRVQPNPVLTADHPWEQTRINLWGSVYWDDQRRLLPHVVPGRQQGAPQPF